MNIDPTLYCARCRTARLHLFAELRPQPRVPDEPAFVDCIYACEYCETVRTWGNEPREETVQGRRLAEGDLTHALDVHGMRRRECPACRGIESDCSDCNGVGRVWAFERPDPCGQTCPLTRFNPQVRA